MTFEAEKPVDRADLMLMAGCGSPWQLYWPQAGLNVVQEEVRLQTEGGEKTYVAGVELSPGVRLDQQNLAIDLCTSLRGLKWLQFRLLIDPTEPDRHLLMYVPLLADLEANFLMAGEWTTVHITLANGTLVNLTPTDCQQQFRHLRVVLEDKAGTAAELRLRRVRPVPRPQRGHISLHFDDGYQHHLWAAELLKRYSTPAAELRATAYVMPRQLGLPNYLTQAQVHRLVDEYGWEIAAHHHDPLTEMQPSHFTTEMAYIIDFFKQQGWGDAPLHFAYPLGKLNPSAWCGIRQYFASARLIAGGPETLPPSDWHRLRAINVTPLTPAKHLAQIAQQAIETGGWAIYMFHHLVDQPQTLTEYAQSEFEAFLAFLREQGYGTTSMKTLYQQFGS